MLFAAAASGALVRLRICVAWDAQPEVDMASLSLRMRDVITRFWCGLLDEDQVSALWDGGGEGSTTRIIISSPTCSSAGAGWAYAHHACRLLVRR